MRKVLDFIVRPFSLPEAIIGAACVAVNGWPIRAIGVVLLCVQGVALVRSSVLVARSTVRRALQSRRRVYSETEVEEDPN